MSQWEQRREELVTAACSLQTHLQLHPVHGDKGFTRPMENHGDHHIQMSPLADNPLCFIMVITHVTAVICKYFFNSMQPSYRAQNAPKFRRNCEEKKCGPWRSLLSKETSGCAYCLSQAEVQLCNCWHISCKKNSKWWWWWERGTSVQSLFPSPGTFDKQEKLSFLLFRYACIYSLKEIYLLCNSSKISQWGLFVERNRYGGVIHIFPGWNKYRQ